jgi:SPP1 family predicted phage head-tail adaptor
MAIRAGRLRHLVTIQSQATAQDAYGAAVRAWSDLATVWAEIAPLTGRELWAAQQTAATTTHRVTMRHHPDVTSACRLQFGSRIFGIDSVLNPEERGERLVLLCTEGIGDGG